MGKREILTLFLGLSIGVNLMFVLGATADSAGSIAVCSARVQGGGEAEAVYIIDKENKRLAVYMMTGSRLELKAVRDWQYDFKWQQFGTQVPSIVDMKEPQSPSKGRRPK